MIRGSDPPRIRIPSPFSFSSPTHWLFDLTKELDISSLDSFHPSVAASNGYQNDQPEVEIMVTPHISQINQGVKRQNDALEGMWAKENTSHDHKSSFFIQQSDDTASDQTITPRVEDMEANLSEDSDDVCQGVESGSAKQNIFSINVRLSDYSEKACERVPEHSQNSFKQVQASETRNILFNCESDQPRIDDKGWNVVETAHLNASSEVFLGKPGNGRSVINVAAIPARAIFGSLLHPSVFQRSSSSWDLAVGYSISTTPTLNRVLLGSIKESEGTMKVEMTTEGWLIPERIIDIKYLLQDSIIVAFGRTVALTNKGTGSSISSKRPIIKPFVPCASFTFTDEQINKSIREVEVIPDDCDILVSSDSSRLSRMRVDGSRFVRDGTYTFGLDGVSSARALPRFPDFASCTLDSGHLYCFDARARWEPVKSINLPFIQKDDVLVSHDWINPDICVCASFSDEGSYLTYVDIRSTQSVLLRKKVATLPYDIRTKDGSCLVSGEPTFTFIPNGSFDHFSPLPPPVETDYSPNTLCTFVDNTTFLSASSHINLRLWGLVA